MEEQKSLEEFSQELKGEEEVCPSAEPEEPEQDAA